MLMNRKFQFKSVRTRLAIWFLVVGMAPLLAAIVVIYFREADAVRERVFSRLGAIRELKVRELNNWLDGRIGDIRTIAGDFEIRDLGRVHKKQPRTQADQDILDNARKLLLRYIENHGDFSELFVINPVTGKIEISTDRRHEGDDRGADLYFTGPMASKDVYIRDVYHSPVEHRPAMAFAIPIFAREGGAADREIAGILVARVHLDSSLHPLLSSRTGMGRTGETLIVNRDAIALSDLRHFEHATLKLKIAAQPAVRAARGQTGIIETEDYRGEKVLAAYAHVPRTGWGFVAKQDLTELYAPIRTLLRQMLMILGVSAVVIFVPALGLAQTISRPIQAIADVAGRIREGDLSARCQTSRADELGALGASFNSMAEHVAGQIAVRSGGADVAETMVAATSLPQFADGLLGKLMALTDSALGAFHARSADGLVLEPIASVGLSVEKLRPFDAKTGEGQFGRAIAAGTISHIKEIPEDTVFTFRTIVGTALPREILTIPLKISRRVAAVVSLGTLGEYSDVHLDIVGQSRLAMSTAYSNLLANEETQHMADELRANNEELAATNEELESQSEELREQADELKGLAAELDAQRVQVEEANRLKSEFLSNMSHELRTPLNSVMALSQLMISRGTGQDAARDVEYLRIIERNGRHLLNLINDILDLSKIEAGRMDLVLTEFDLRQVLTGALDTVGPMAAEKALKMPVQIGPVPRMYSDEDKVRQIVLNLLSNAVKFTDRGEVATTVSASEEEVSIVVRDTGIGISRADCSHIFDEFRQVDGSTTRRHEGTGLGLAICRKLARLLGGDIFVTSRPGESSSFTVTLPIRCPKLSRGVSAVLTPEMYPAPSGPATTLTRRRILVIDDDPIVRELLRSYLTEAGCDVTVAPSGREGLRLARQVRPSAITLDVMMPDVDGWEVMRELKAAPETAEIPVLIVSVSDDRTTGMALGAVGYIVKPVDKAQLLAEIERVATVRTVRRILVVDDDPAAREHICEVLREGPYAAETASGGAEALERVRASRPDVMVLDLMMPEVDGFAVLDQLRADPATADLPVVVLTAKDLTADEQDQLKRAARAVITKGRTDKERLLQEVHAAIEELGGPRPSAGPVETPTILVVEDNDVAAMQIRAALTDAGYAVTVADGGAEALASVEHAVPDGVVLDLMMPGIDGFGVLEQIRGTPATAELPVLVLTAKELTAEDRARLRHHAVQRLIQKGSVDREQLVRCVASLLGSAPPAVQAEPAPAPDVRPSVSAPPPAGKGVLVVEDNADNLATITAILDEMDCPYVTVQNGEAAVAAARQHRPGLILMDLQLPGVSGLEVARQIKADPGLAGVPIVALTAKAMRGDREHALASGCDDYITKPFSPDDVIGAVRKWLK